MKKKIQSHIEAMNETLDSMPIPWPEGDMPWLNVKKKGKTRGRPSKAEKLITLIVKDWAKRNMLQLYQATVTDPMLFGFGAYTELENGDIERIDPTKILIDDKGCMTLPKQVRNIKTIGIPIDKFSK